MNIRTPQRLVLAACAAMLMTSALTACIPLVAGGMASGALLATDRRTSGAQLEDEGIELRALNRIRSTIGDRVHVNLTSYNRQVLLTGEVPSAQDKAAIEQIVSRVENVSGVVNDLEVMSATTLSQRSSDTLVTARVKAALIDARDLQFNAFKVVTERGVVYLMGRVTQREADRATAVARSTTDVRKVVRVFEILSEAELARLQPALAKAPATDTKPAQN